MYAKGAADIDSRELISTGFEKGFVFDGRYRIVGTIGRGGMGIVYAVEDLKLERTLRAMKVTVPFPEGYGTYSDEAITLMKLNHPHLPVIVDYFPAQEHGCEVLILDYIDGQTIAAIIGNSKARFSFAQIVHIGLQLCSALSYMHEQAQPIIHRDLKPSNVMLDHKGHVKLIDFGISRQYKEGQLQDTVQLGTVGFAAPEQEGGGQSDARTDIYGLGALLYYMATGGLAYVRQAAGFHAGDLFGAIQADVPHAFRSVLERMLQSKPQYRFPSMEEAGQAIKQFATQPGQANAGGVSWNRSVAASSKQMLVTVLSLSPGAGSTFISLTLAALLGDLGLTVTAAEYSGLSPEWHALLPLAAREGNPTRNGDIAFDDRYFSYTQTDKGLSWFALQPERKRESIVSDDQKFDQMLRMGGGMVNLIDLSGKWEEPDALQLLKKSRFVFVVADPSVAKWQASRIRKLNALGAEMRSSGAALHWIANKDERFRDRSEWLSLFPDSPLAAVPLLPQGVILHAQWRGRWVTDENRLYKRLNHALKPIFTLLNSEVNAKQTILWYNNTGEKL